jgi:uncharacterized protein (DUF488 family)
VADAPVLYTIGHSTRQLDELVALLAAARVRALVDVRTAPGSRRHPQFGRDALATALPEHGVDYRHEPSLGGFRRAHPDSDNGGWEHPAFRGYADYMQTAEFAQALARLEQEARTVSTAIMCAEAQWWRCHRRLIADALVARGWCVLHLGLGRDPVGHELTAFAVPGADGALRYPSAQARLTPQRSESS